MARQVYAGMRRDGGPIGFWVYIMASARYGTLYIGQTDDLGARVSEHRAGLRPGFTRKYGCKTLVWAEWHETRTGAVMRERRLKEWRRSWKVLLIEKDNPLGRPARLLPGLNPPPCIPAKAGIQMS